VLTQTTNFGAETHLGGGVTRTFVFELAAIAGAQASTFIGSTVKAHKNLNTPYIDITVVH